jgi:hypothetical protein
MSKLLKHKWNLLQLFPFKKHQCLKCGTIRFWSFDYNCTMYEWGTNIAYRAPKCILFTEKPYNKIEIN